MLIEWGEMPVYQRLLGVGLALLGGHILLTIFAYLSMTWSPVTLGLRLGAIIASLSDLLYEVSEYLGISLVVAGWSLWARGTAEPSREYRIMLGTGVASILLSVLAKYAFWIMTAQPILTEAMSITLDVTSLLIIFGCILVAVSVIQLKYSPLVA